MIGLIISLTLILLNNDLPFIEEFSIDENYKKIGEWYCLPEGKRLTIRVQAKNTKEILFWAIPTGTGTYWERKLIGKDSDGSDGWSIKWEYPEPVINSHIEVTAIGAKGKDERILFNVTGCDN